jgi:hypothetical protein
MQALNVRELSAAVLRNTRANIGSGSPPGLIYRSSVARPE